MKTAYLSLGANLGDRFATIRAALAALEDARLTVTRLSSWYETEPQGIKDQPWFVNVAAEVKTDLLPMQLLLRAQRIERELGRRGRVRNGPRPIDIDIVFFGSFTVRCPKLEIPHPRMGERRFVLEPLAELAPELRHPGSRKTVRELLAEVRGQNLRRVAGPAGGS